MLKTLFFGTPPAAVPFLRGLAKSSQLACVVSSPDKPAGRGYELSPTAVKKEALALGLPVLQPASLKDPAFRSELEKRGPFDLGLVVAYGKLVPAEIFSIPRLGLVNVHFSLLPRFRGAAPVQWALIRGEKETGVTLFKIEAGLDTGPVYLQASLPIAQEDDAPALREKLSGRGLDLVDELLRRLEKGGWAPSPQAGAPSLAPVLKKEDGRLLWDRLSAAEAAGLVRGTIEWPGAFSRLKGQLIKVRKADVRPAAAGSPGEIIGVEKDAGFLVKCREDALLVRRLQPEGRKEMDAPSFWNGARLGVGDRFDREGL